MSHLLREPHSAVPRASSSAYLLRGSDGAGIRIAPRYRHSDLVRVDAEDRGEEILDALQPLQAVQIKDPQGTPPSEKAFKHAEGIVSAVTTRTPNETAL